MAIKNLSDNEALSEGAELWIIPDRKHSYWARQIDWHLQFLISRSMIHQSPSISPELQNIVKDNELETLTEETPKNSPLLIFSTDLLPNRETIHLPYSSNFKSWIERANEIWKSLKSPTVRVFLPREHDAEEFSEHWSFAKGDKKSGITVVVDPGGH